MILSAENQKLLKQKELQLADASKQIGLLKQEIKIYGEEKKSIESEIFLLKNNLSIGQDLKLPDGKKGKLIRVENSWGLFMIIKKYGVTGKLLNAEKRIYRPTQIEILNLNK